VDIATLTAAGFDLVHPFDAHAVARVVGVEALVDAERPLGYLVANTRALWPIFLAARRADRALTESSDPIDRYTEQICAQLAGARCWFVHRAYDGAFLPFQRIAVAAGFGTLAPSRLLVHPTYGPWFGLRAIVLVAGDPITRLLAPAPCDCADRCGAAFDRARDAQESWRAWLAVRDACCVGREHRYDDDQLEYHYTKDLALLR
jgi:methylmalonic aciduria homocystinuria type C protein